MGLWKKIFGEKKTDSKAGKTTPSKKLDQNLEIIKEMLKDCDDIVYREFEIGVEKEFKAAVVYVDGMVDKNLINNFILNTSMVATRIVEPNATEIKQQLSQHMKDHTFAVTEISEQETLEDAIKFALSGDTVLLLDNCDTLFTVGSKGFPARGVSEPVTESVIRGPRDGFTETFRFNTALIRRRIRDTKLKVKGMQIGTRSKTDVALMYIEDVVNETVLKEAKKRLDSIDIDVILDSGYVEQFIEDDWTSPFPQIHNTERPDVVAAALYEGRVAIVVDNSPFVLIVPGTINSMMQSAEDYYERWSIASAVRLLRYFAATISLLLPSLYVAMTSFHPEMMPTQLTLALAVGRESVPFPAIVEALIMETTIELLREAGVRLPGPIGATIGIVGGLVIGQAAVEAGIVAPLMVIVVAVTAISSFAIPRYSLAIGFRLLRFLFIFSAGMLGLYGIMLALLLLLIHLASLKSFGVPYLSPFVTFIEESGDLGDTFVREPLLSMNLRNAHANPRNRNRLDDKRREFFGNKEEK